MIQTAIREGMGRKHVSLSKLARDAHVQRATIYAWFDGQRPEPDTWDRVAGQLDLPDLDTLLHQHAVDPTDVVTAIHENTEVLREVLRAITARLPEPPPAVLSGIAAEEAALERDRRRTKKPPRSIDPRNPSAVRDRAHG